MNYKVLITTSGVGSRLGDLTRHTNKALVRIGKKPAISYIIEAYPKNVGFVVTLGYYGKQVKDFLNLAYPDRKIEYAHVDKYEGTGTSLGYSMLQAKKLLQCPFIYHACDTLVTEKILKPDKNWIGGFRGGDSTSYASWKIINSETLIFGEKGAINFDFLHIGLVGIWEYKKFWGAMGMLYKSDPNNSTLNDCQTIEKMLDTGSRFKIVEFKSWLDIGNTTALNHARSTIGDYFANLDKSDESIFIFNNFVIKFFYDADKVKKRVARAKVLKGLIPKIEGAKENFYRYEFIDGDLYSRVANREDFVIFLNWAKKNIWVENNAVETKKFKKICWEFYHDKTLSRIERFLKDNNIKDREEIINGEKVPTIKTLLSKVDFNQLADAKQYRIHGDLILENIIKTRDSYKLIDWRHDFGGLNEVGDIHYDLAKLNHNLTVNHDVISANQFSIKITDNKVDCDILRRNNLIDCQKELFRFSEANGIDSRRLKLLTSLIWLNMSPLHHYPFNLFLYYFGKLNLSQTLKNNF